MLVLQLIIYLCFGVACSLIAKQRGRSPVGWFFVGLFASCIGLILVLVLPDLRKQQEEMDRLRAQNRMLKERLDKDRMVADQRQGEIEGRLRAHDRVLGVDTGKAPEQLAAPPACGRCGNPAASDPTRSCGPRACRSGRASATSRA